MAKRRGAPSLVEREDPLSFVLRNRPAREILERLQGQPLLIPIDLRKSVGIHPETFRRVVFDLDRFALISIRALPRPKSRNRPRSHSLRIPIGIELSPGGKNVLRVTRGVRATVQRHARLLPESSTEHWLPA